MLHAQDMRLGLGTLNSAVSCDSANLARKHFIKSRFLSRKTNEASVVYP